jgi:hypothetical protein
MCRSGWSLARIASLVVLGCLAIGGCSPDPRNAPKRPTPTVFTAKDASCDHDRTSIDAKNTIERVGGLVSDDYVVRFSQSTRLGVVALVDGDTKEAFHDLAGTYGVALVAQIDDDGTSKVTGFQQVRELVASVCD